MVTLGGLTPRSTFQNFCCHCPCPHGEPQPPLTSAGGPPTLAGRSGSVSYGVTVPSPGSQCAHYFVCALQEWTLCFPQSCWSLAIKSRQPSKSDSLGIPPPVARPPGLEAWCGVRTFTPVGGLLWYKCSPVCESPTQQIWDLILLWLCPSYHLILASSLSLDVGYFFGELQCLPVYDCSTVSCDSDALSRGSECMSFYSTIVNQSLMSLQFPE